MRDGAITALDGGTPESIWVSEQLGHPVIKAFNAVLAHTLAERDQRRAALIANAIVPEQT
jgi:predicted dinucleotide-binding enzyme